MLECLAVEKLHGDKRLAFVLANFVNGANVGMVERRSGLRFTLETFHCLAIVCNGFRQELQRDEAAKPGVFGLVDHAHSTAAELFDDAVVRNRGADEGICAFHLPLILGGGRRQVNEGRPPIRDGRAAGIMLRLKPSLQAVRSLLFATPAAWFAQFGTSAQNSATGLR